MGNTCCNVENLPDIESEIPKFELLEPVDIPEGDALIQEWRNENSISSDRVDESKMKLLQLKHGDTLFYSEWIEGHPEGKGFLYNPKTLFFSGYFKKGVPFGTATVKLLNKECEYEGFVKGWKAHGNGTLYDSKNKFELTGQWNNSRPITGIITLLNDPNIQCIELEDFDSGKGIIRYKDSREYEGEIHVKKLLPHGHGKVVFPPSSSKKFYEGKWYLGMMIGEGKMEYLNLTYYEGEFFNSKREGKGKFHFSNGTYYDGLWKEGKQEGCGAMFSGDGKVMKYGLWKNGKFDKLLTFDEWERINEKSLKEREKHDILQSEEPKKEEEELASEVQPISNNSNLYSQIA